MAFVFNNIQEVGGLTVQLSFGMPNKGVWPKYSIMFFPVATNEADQMNKQ